MTVVYSENPQVSERYRLTLGQDVIAVSGARELRDLLDVNPDENLVIIGPDIKFDIAIAMAEYYRTTRPSLGVVMVRTRLEVSTLSQAMRAGVRELVASDDASALLAATKRSLEVSGKMAQSASKLSVDKGKIILVFSAKGGCGKTTVSTNLADALALDQSKTVCLVDFDLQFGDVAVALQIEPVRTISDAIRMESSLDKQGLKSLLVQYKPNFSALLAPVDPSDVEFITADLAEKILAGLQEMFDYVVIDAPPAFTDVILKTFDMADDYLLLSTLDLPSLKNLKVTLGTLDALGMPRSKWHIVVNRSTSNAGLMLADVEAAIGLQISATIPASDMVPIMINQGRTVVSGNPKHSVAKAMMTLARRVEREGHGASEPTRRGLFGRRRARK